MSWDLHDHALHHLLFRLDADQSTAGEKYEQLRRGLVKIFDWRGASAPDICADETIDRVARKLAGGVIIDDIVAFGYGVARLVMLEQSRRPEARQVSLDEAIGIVDISPREREDTSRLPCLERCLDELDADDPRVGLRRSQQARGERERQRVGVERAGRIARAAFRVERPRDVFDLRITKLMSRREIGAASPEAASPRRRGAGARARR